MSKQVRQWQQWGENLQFTACCLLAFSLPFRFKGTSICIWVVLLGWLLSGNYRETWERLKSGRGYWLWGGLFVLYALSYFYSEDKPQAQFEITQKLSFVLLPILVGAGLDITRRRFEQILLSFISGISVVALACIMRAGYMDLRMGSHAYWFYHQLVSGLDMNAVYMAWYVTFSISVLLLFRWEHFFQDRQRVLRWLAIALQAAFLVLLSSRMLLVIFFVVTLPLYFANLYQNVRLSRVRLGMLLVGILLFITAVAFTPNPVRQRFDDVMHNDFRQSFLKDYRNDPQHFNNLTLRVFVWRVGLENLQVHRLWWKGAGIGDVHALQNRRIAEYGIRNMSDADHPPPTLYNMNLHNMYLQAILALGIPGLVVFLCLVLSPFFFLSQSGDKRSWLIFHFSACAFMLQESIFQTQAGIIHYAFFSVIFWQAVHRKKATQSLGKDASPT
jgi:O-antigen ligase